jgi:hypothetical protein
MNPVRPCWFYTYVLKSHKDGEFYGDDAGIDTGDLDMETRASSFI